MERTAVDSSNLASVGYDEANQVLEIEFTSGAVYQYFEVPVEVYDQLMNADSHGSYFNGLIKGAFVYQQVKKKRR